ncbi:MAG: GNAT family N-acetyltransferase [Sphingobacteriia bacterium]|nr:GNAT family N-acetyltransferase [Sphingobacteriia bacterium]
MTIKDPILLNLPFSIKTKNLFIRPCMPGDGKMAYEAFLETIDQLKEWFGWAHNINEANDIEKTYRMFFANFILRKEFQFIIFQEEKFLGSCALHDINWRVPSAKMGYWCRESEQRKGYMREAISVLTIYAFEHIGIKRLEINCNDENLRSAKLAEKLGFKLEVIAPGLVNDAKGSELKIGRSYARYNTEGLDKAILIDIQNNLSIKTC